MNKILLTIIGLFFLQILSVQATTFKIATLSPDGSMWMTEMRAGAKIIKEKTSGRIKFKFYPGGVMGDNKAVLRKIRIGQLHGGALTAGSLTRFYTDNQIYSLVLKYKSQGEIDYVRKTLDPVIMAGLEKGGFVTFGLAETGFAYVMSTKNPVSSVAQLKKQKAWIPANDPVALEAIRAFEVTPIPLPLGDVLAGLQTGLIDTIAASPIGALALQWHTQIKYITELPILYSYGTLAISNKAFKKAKPDDQKIIRQVMGKIFHEIDEQNKKDNKAAYAALKKQDIIFVKPTQAEIKEWHKYADAAQKRLISSGRITKGMVSRVDKLIKAYRSRK